MKTIRKFFHWNNLRNYISFEISYLPMCQIGINFGQEDITFSIGFLIQFYVSLSLSKLNHLIYKHKIYDRALRFSFWFGNAGTIMNDRFVISVNLMSDTTGWKKGGWNWYLNISGKLKGKFTVSKKIIEIKDIFIPMPEKSYKAHAVLADWTWHYPRWFPKTIRRCEIEIPEGLPHAGKGENSWDCGDDATFGLTTGKVRSIAEAVGELVGIVLETRVKNGSWNDWCWTRKKVLNLERGNDEMLGKVDKDSDKRKS